jgi:hypothetical protein
MRTFPDSVEIMSSQNTAAGNSWRYPLYAFVRRSTSNSPKSGQDRYQNNLIAQIDRGHEFESGS